MLFDVWQKSVKCTVWNARQVSVSSFYLFIKCRIHDKNWNVDTWSWTPRRKRPSLEDVAPREHSVKRVAYTNNKSYRGIGRVGEWALYASPKKTWLFPLVSSSVVLCVVFLVPSNIQGYELTQKMVYFNFYTHSMWVSRKWKVWAKLFFFENSKTNTPFAAFEKGKNIKMYPEKGSLFSSCHNFVKGQQKK